MTAPPPHDWHAPIIAAIVAAYGRHRPPVYVEIGVDRGHTMRAVAPHAGWAHAVDVTFANLPRDQPLGLNVTCHEMSSSEFWRLVGPTLRPDVVFIDGDHSAPAVRADLQGALDCLRPDGAILLHDTFPGEQRWAESHCGDGYRIVEETRKVPWVDCATLPIFPGLTLVTPHRAAIA